VDSGSERPSGAVGRGRTLIVAHRGAWGEAPQNSLQALTAAIEAGCEMVELDVRRTRDGQLVAVHDARVQGTPVAELSHEQLRSRLAPGQAPLLSEMVALAGGRIGLDVELKEAGYVSRTMDELSGLDPGQCVVTSFLDEVLVRVRETAPELRTGLLVAAGARGRRLEARMQETGASFLAPQAGLARAGMLAWAAKRGLESYVWTVNDRRALRTMLTDERVAAVITDRPATALNVRAGAQR
jgi:glycerophosphoryl diester phosphodiesterase